MPGNPLTDPNWARDLADTVERIVGEVRDRTTSKVVLLARGVVFGILAGLLGMTALVLLLITLVRATQELLDLVTTHARAVYLSYFVVGGICCLLGVFLMRQRRSTDA